MLCVCDENWIPVNFTSFYAHLGEKLSAAVCVFGGVVLDLRPQLQNFGSGVETEKA